MSRKGGQSKQEREGLTNRHGQREALSEHQLVATRYEYKGILPPPEVVEGWERILPGSFDRAFTMAEKDQDMAIEKEKHVIFMEKETLAANKEFGRRELNLARSGQLYVFGGISLILGGAIYLLARGIDIAGYVTLGAGLIPIMAAVIRQTARDRDKTPEK